MHCFWIDVYFVDVISGLLAFSMLLFLCNEISFVQIGEPVYDSNEGVSLHYTRLYEFIDLKLVDNISCNAVDHAIYRDMKTFLQWLEAMQVSSQMRVKKKKTGQVLPPAPINPSMAQSVIQGRSVVG